jgi:hypothetical protein
MVVMETYLLHRTEPLVLVMEMPIKLLVKVVALLSMVGQQSQMDYQ